MLVKATRKEHEMHPLEGPAKQMEWAASNTAYNLGFIPEDKLGWKPAPTAKSALEITNHVCGFILGMIPVARDGAWQDPQFTPATDLKSAQDLLSQAGEGYGAALRTVDPSRLAGETSLPFGTFPTSQALTMPIVDMLHHHGQIAYIQTLLGDEEMHFQGM
jgi:hypothetical protein